MICDLIQDNKVVYYGLIIKFERLFDVCYPVEQVHLKFFDYH